MTESSPDRELLLSTADRSEASRAPAMRAILLDLDDTLLDDRSATANGFVAFLSAHKHRCAYVDDDEALVAWRDAARRHWIRYEQGELSFQEQRRWRVREFLGKALNDTDADAAFLVYQQAYEASWQLLPDVSEFLARTHAVPKVIITNGDRETQLRKVTVTGLRVHVRGVITPADCGHWKPSVGMFRAALELLNVRPEHCLMIGDDPVRDVEPAAALGIRSFRVQSGVPGCGLLDAIASA
jgi:putative hydrolase of the HAD superfamily